jgi:hypothetical protein
MSTERFIDQLYDRYFNRSADISGKNYWLGEIDSRAMNASQVTQGFINSTEFNQKTSPLINLYYAVFDRIPDMAGLSYWLSARQQGLSLLEISDTFLNSIEYLESYHTLQNNDADFIHILYQNVLDRTADEVGLTYWLGQLNAIGLSRAAVLSSFSDSIEFQSKNSSIINVLLNYYGILGIQPDQQTLNLALSENNQALVTRLYADDLYTGEAVPYLISKGIVIVEGIVKNATVFIDTNFNEELDKGEVSTTTDGAGRWDFKGNVTYTGQVVAYGGIDSITAKPINGKMVVKAGIFEISPKTVGNGTLGGYIDDLGNVDSSNDTTAPVISSSAIATPIDENSGAGQAIYTVVATDDSGTVSYSLKTGSDNPLFSIDENSGIVTLMANPEFDIQPIYTFTVVATDPTGNIAEKAVSLKILGLEDKGGFGHRQVIFDLVNNKSSLVNGTRSFDSSLDYDIYIIMPILGGNGSYEFTSEQMWHDAQNLSPVNGSSDHIRFIYEGDGTQAVGQRTWNDSLVNPATQHVGYDDSINAILQGDSTNSANWKEGIQPELAPRTSLLSFNGDYIDYNADDLIGGTENDLFMIFDLWTGEINTPSFSTFITIDQTVGVVGDIPGLQSLYDAL